MREMFVRCLMERASKDDKIFVITPDMGFSIFEEFAEKFPDKFMNVGVAEQNAIGVAAGMALSGKTVFVYSFIPFITMRPFEQIRIDIAYMNTNVRLIGIGAGLSYGALGATHHAIEDIAIMRSLPNMTVCCPGDPIEVRELINDSFSYNGPIYFRLNTHGEPNVHPVDTKIRIGKAVFITEGDDLALITTSTMLEDSKKMVDEWANKDIHATLLSVPTIKPLDIESITKLIDSGMPIVTLEEHTIIGGLGTAVSEVIAESGKSVRFKRLGIPDEYSHYIGSQKYLLKKYGLIDSEKILNYFINKA